MPCSVIERQVQPSERCTERIGRDWLIKKISFMRTAKICPVTSFAWSLSRNTLSGAIFSGPIAWMPATRAFSSSVLVGMVPIRRLQAKGDTQFERTLKRAMSSAIDFDRPTMPSLAAA